MEKETLRDAEYQEILRERRVNKAGGWEQKIQHLQRQVSMAFGFYCVM